MFAACCTSKKKKQTRGIEVHPKPTEKPLLNEVRRSDQFHTSVTVSMINVVEEQKKNSGMIRGNAAIVVE